jgi:hypothetical protein
MSLCFCFFFLFSERIDRTLSLTQIRTAKKIQDHEYNERLSLEKLMNMSEADQNGSLFQLVLQLRYSPYRLKVRFSLSFAPLLFCLFFFPLELLTNIQMGFVFSLSPPVRRQ